MKIELEVRGIATKASGKHLRKANEMKMRKEDEVENFFGLGIDQK